jgi:hypothetical protein
MLGDRFLCDNKSKCLNYTVIWNGIDDCLDQTDELICFWDRNGCKVGHFACSDKSKCQYGRCDTESNCPNRSNWFWCPNSTVIGTIYRSSKYERLSNSERSCYRPATAQLTSTTTSTLSSVVVNTKRAIVRTRYGLCNRAFYLTT